MSGINANVFDNIRTLKLFDIFIANTNEHRKHYKT